MGLDVYFRRDIANVLRATACASEGAAQMATLDTVQLDAYRQGVRNTLLAVGLAFGLEPVGPQVQRGASPPLAGLLWAEIPHER